MVSSLTKAGESKSDGVTNDKTGVWLSLPPACDEVVVLSKKVAIITSYGIVFKRLNISKYLSFKKY